MIELKTTTRRYQLWHTKDLFGAWVLVRRWGGVGRAISGTKTEVFKTEAECIARLEQIARKKRKKGYIDSVKSPD